MKEVIITIKSTVKNGDNTDTTELITDGKYELLNDGCELQYEETEATGYEGSSTGIRITSGVKLEMLRTGSVNSELYIETGRKNYCQYGTPFGSFTVAVFANSIHTELDENGGKVIAMYTMDVDAAPIGTYTLEIFIKPKSNVETS